MDTEEKGGTAAVIIIGEVGIIEVSNLNDYCVQLPEGSFFFTQGEGKREKERDIFLFIFFFF
jgi:hypothetical protein